MQRLAIMLALLIMKIKSWKKLLSFSKKVVMVEQQSRFAISEMYHKGEGVKKRTH